MTTAATAPVCRICQSPLDVHQAARGRICGEPECRRKIALLDRVEERERRRELVGRMEELKVRVVGEGEAGRFALAVLPSNDQPLAPLSAERRAGLEEHVARVVAEASRSRNEPPPFPVVESEVPAFLTAACGFCRGRCCSLGRHRRGYVDVPTLRRYAADRPDLTLLAVGEEYVSRLPERVYRDSCIYHSETGCALPREMRAEVCRTFLCGEVLETIEEYPRSGTPPVFVVCVPARGEPRHTVLEGDPGPEED